MDEILNSGAKKSSAKVKYNQRKTCLSPDSLVNKLRSAWKRADSNTSKIARALMLHRTRITISK
jgi:hypothetical protein